MNTRLWTGILIAVFIVILGLTWALFAIPAPTPPITATTTPPVATTTPTLAERVIVTSPKPNAVVGQTFVVSGAAPPPAPAHRGDYDASRCNDDTDARRAGNRNFAEAERGRRSDLCRLGPGARPVVFRGIFPD